MRRWLCIGLLCALLAAALCSTLLAPALADEGSQQAALRVAAFSADVTIPLNHRCMGILPTKSKEIVDPLQAHGFVLLGAGKPIVLVAVDWCEIRNGAYDQWRKTLAKAAGTSRERVIVSSIHQHDAPVTDSGAAALLAEVGMAGELYDLEFHKQAVDRVAAALKDSLKSAKPATHIGLGQAKVEKVASTRRVVLADGRVAYNRYSSSGGNEFHANAPDGDIDPLLRTISFWNGDEPLVALSSYAVHPMSYYGRGGVTYDFVGMARERRRRDDARVQQIYVSGCSGDVTAGKYNNGSQDSRLALAEQIYHAMKTAWENTKRQPLENVAFRNTQFDLEFHEGEEFTTEALTKTLKDEHAKEGDRILAAMSLSSLNRIAVGQKIDMPCLDLGSAQIVLFPGEVFVGYQLMAQEMRPDSFVMSIGYGECWPGYVPTKQAFEEKFGHGWRWVSEGAEARIRDALARVLLTEDNKQSKTVAEPGDQLTLSPEVRERCLQVLRNGFRGEEFWPSIHAAEGLTLGGYGEEIIAPLRAKLKTETDDQRRCGLARELVRAGEILQAGVMLGVLAGEDPHGHVHAAESLYKVIEIGDGQALRQAMQQKQNPSLLLMAAGALGRSGNAEAMTAVRKEVVNQDEAIARIAAWLLGRIGNQSDIPRLRERLKTAQEPLTLAYFQNSLAALGDEQGLAALAESLHSENPALRTYAATFAGDARAISLKDPLIAQLDDENLDARIRAAQTLLFLSRPSPPPADANISTLAYPANDEHPRFSEGSVIRLADGSLLYAVTEFSGSGSDFAGARIIGKTSSDGGRTWSQPRVLQKNVGKMNVMSVTLRRLALSQRIALFYLVKDSFDELNVFVRFSHDETQSFTEPVQVTSEEGYHVLNNDRVTQLSSGRLLVPVAWTRDVHQENHFVSFCYLSDDGGKTWRRGSGQVDYARRGAMEPEVVELRDESVMMIVRTQLGHIAASHSSDGGENWSEPKPLDATAPEAPATLRRIPATGDLLLVWNNNFKQGGGHGGRRTPLTAAISANEGKTWRNVRNLETDPQRTFAYTSLIFVKDRAVLSYWDRSEKPDRISSRFRSVPVNWFYAAREE